MDTTKKTETDVTTEATKPLSLRRETLAVMKVQTGVRAGQIPLCFPSVSSMKSYAQRQCC